MDEFGVLTERYGLKPQGKSTPMAASKGPPSKTNASTRNFEFDSGLGQKPASYTSKSSWNSSSVNGSMLDDHDIFFQSSTKQKPQNSFGLDDDYGDIFGGLQKATKLSNTKSNSGSSFDYDSIFSNFGIKSSTNLYDDDLFGGIPGLNNSKHASTDDVFASFASPPKQNADFLGDFGGMGVKSNGSSRNGSWEAGQNEAGLDDLIPGFGGSSPSNKGTNNKPTTSTFKFKSSEDPFVIFESTSSPVNTSSELPADPLEEFSKFNHSSGGTKTSSSSIATPTLRSPPKPAQVVRTDKVNSSVASSIDDLEDFAMGRAHNKASRYKEAEDATQKTQQNGADDLESFFSMNSRSNSVPKSRATSIDPMFDANIQNKEQKASTSKSSSMKKASSANITHVVDDLSSIFGGAPMFGEFEKVEGESEERQRARMGRHQRTQDRVARAVADMNQRDCQTQYEQEERRRIAETLDIEIKRWAVGKEGNMRALLSSLQLVLWPECDWQSVSLADLITSTSVKKVYRKATLCIHPDKVQQKGATLEQKYIAEKVFDILKEAWNKFNKEELS